MKKKIYFWFCLMAVVLVTMAGCASATPTERTMKVTTIDRNRDMVTCVDGEGQVWQFFGAEDYLVGDLVSCEIDDKGTLGYSDDVILNHHYIGVFF